MDPRKIRIVCDAPAQAELQINELYKDYQLLTVNISMRGEQPLITAIMLDRRELPRQQQVMVAAPGGFRQ